jgi:hypothetical protein
VTEGVTAQSETRQQLLDSCAKMGTDTEAVSSAARERANERLRRSCSELAASVAAHVQLADARLPSLIQRRLLHDHHRLLQLARSIELAVADGDARAAVATARRLSDFIQAHRLREASE